MKTINAEILKNLLENQDLVSVTLIEQNGSTPRTAGAKMLVFRDKSIVGTIGGGLYEAKAMDLALHVFEEATRVQNLACLMYFDLTGSASPTDMDMVCGGELRLLLEHIAVNNKNIEIYQNLTNAEKEGEGATFISCIYAPTLQTCSIQNCVAIEKHLVTEETLHTESLLPAEIFNLIDTNSHKPLHNITLKNKEYIFESLPRPYKLHIFGAGHVSCELAKITHYLSFKTIVLDDRENFANAIRFPNAKSIVLPSLSQKDIEQYLQENSIAERDGIIIVTRGHARDRDALAAALKTKAGYLGMIGSKSKRQTTYDFLLKNGFNKSDFERVHSPIGLTIGAQTPEEIAISICAELIMWRAGK